MRSSSAKNEAVRYTVYTNQLYKFNEFQWNSGKSGYLSLAMLLLQGRKEVGRAQLCLAYWNKWTALCCLATARKGHRIELIPSPIHSKHPLSMVPMECGNSQQKTMVSYMNGGRDSTVAWHPRQGHQNSGFRVTIQRLDSTIMAMNWCFGVVWPLWLPLWTRETLNG